MAEPRTLEDLSSEERGEDDQEEEELENLEKLEAEVKQMAQRILEYRTTLPDQFKSTLSSILVSQRPILPHFDIAAESGISGDRTPDGGEHVQLSQDALLAEKDPETAEKICMLKLKISNNVSSMPLILKRMNECISMIDNLDSLGGTIHPAFKRRKS